jgi:GxxExxY protein
MIMPIRRLTMGDGDRIYIEPELNELSRQIIGAAVEVHKHLGPGFPELIYEEAMCIELRARGIPYQRQVATPVLYKGHVVGKGRVDLLVKDAIIVELKAIEVVLTVHQAQLLSYLKARERKLGLLINFNVPILTKGVVRILNPRYPTTQP